MTQEPPPATRVVIDTNVLLPILEQANPQDSWLVKLWTDRRIIPLANPETLDELREKLLERSPTPRHYQATRFADAKLRQYRPWCELTTLETNPDTPLTPKCRDAKDQAFIDLAANGRAEILITEDNDIRSMKDEVTFEIMNQREFRKLMQS